MPSGRRWCGLVLFVVAVTGCGDDLTPEPGPPLDPPPCTSKVKPTAIASIEYTPGGLVLDDDHVYWVDYLSYLGSENGIYSKGSIYRAPRSGGAAVPVASLPDLPMLHISKLTHAAGALFWVEGYDDPASPRSFVRLRTMPAAGGPVSDVMTTEVIGGRIQFVVDDDAAYVTTAETPQDYYHTAVWRVPHGGAPERIGSVDAYATAVVADATYIYGASTLAGLWRMPKTGGDAVFITPGLYGSWELFLDEEHLYWSNDDDDSIATITKTGELVRAIDISRERSGWLSLSLFGEDFYLNGYESIYRVPKRGGEITPVLCPGEGFLEIHRMAADATRLFFIADRQLLVADRP